LIPGAIFPDAPVFIAPLHVFPPTVAGRMISVTVLLRPAASEVLMQEFLNSFAEHQS
jgi:hypothetical protein